MVTSLQSLTLSSRGVLSTSLSSHGIFLQGSGHTELVLTLLQDATLITDHSCTNPVSAYGHSLRNWRLGLQHSFLGGVERFNTACGASSIESYPPFLFCLFWGGGGWTQGLTLAKQELYLLGYTPDLFLL
jgi:hypothetical protein